jgi:lambda family phage portal protein
MASYKYNLKTGKFDQRPTGKRYFQMAQNESFVGWDTTDVSADAALHPQLVQLVSRARDLERSNDYVRNYLRLLKANVIGPNGIKLTACRKARNGRIDKRFNLELESAWKNAGKLKNSPSACGKQSRKDLGDMAMARLAVDGEAIIHHRTGFSKNKYRYAVQFIDSMRLDWRVNGQLANGNRAKMGVEVDEDDRPIAYHILKEHPSEGIFGWNVRNPEYERVLAEEVTHLYLIERPGQTRGITWLAASGMRARMLDKFEEAVCVGARVAASKMAFYKPTDEYDGNEPGEDDGVDLRQEVEPGMMELLPRGIDVDTFDPNFPPANLEEFHKVISRGIAAGVGANYNQIFENYEGVNYSSLREAKLKDRDIWRTLQRFYVEHFEEIWFTRWCEVQQLNGQSALDADKIAALLEDDCYRFDARGWQWVDPLKEIKANIEAVGAGFTSPQRVIADSTGEDPAVILDEIREFNAMAGDDVSLNYQPEPVPPTNEAEEE